MKIDINIVKKKPTQIAGIIILIAITIVPSVYFYLQYQKAQFRLQNPDLFIQEEKRSLMEKVSKLIQLPSSEEPTVATVSNLEKLKDQPFFAQAKNGDKLLIFNNAKKAILYDPVANKIIDVAPVNIGTQSAEATASASTSSPTPQMLKFFLLNGTSKVGLTKTYEETLKKAIPDAIVVDRNNAKKNDYAKTILIDISGTKGNKADQISKLLGIPLEKLPDGEEKPASADFLIIVGSDKL
jgi:hypothetical protein